MTSFGEIDSLIDKVSKLDIKNQRCIWSVVGSCVADAATRPTHWVYDQTKLDEALGDNNPEFWPVSLSPFYTIPTGENSCYNDMGFVMLQSLPTLQSGLNLSHDEYKAKLISYFGPGSVYDDAYKRRLEAYDPAKRYAERQPVEGPWIQHSLVDALPELLNGEVPTGSPDNAETDGLVSTLPLIAQLALKGLTSESFEFQSAIKESAFIVSTNSIALYHTLTAAIVLNNVIHQGEPLCKSCPPLLASINSLHTDIVAESDVELMIEELCTVMSSKVKSHTSLVAHWGKTCSNPGSFMGALHAVVTSTSFVECVRKIIRAGGCNCSRANLAGALMGAIRGVGGENGIPVEWIVKSSKGLEVLKLALEKFSGEERN